MPAISFATIGTSWITDSFIRSAHSTGLWQLVAVCSRNADTAKAFAVKHDIAKDKAYISIDDLARDPAIHVVYIASPNSLHHQQARQLLAANTADGNPKKHIILEKPATSNTAELEDLYALADSNQVFLLEAYRHLHEVNFQVLRDVALPKLTASSATTADTAASNKATVYGASLTYASYSSRYEKVLSGDSPTPNIFSLDFSGGSLVDLGVYPISMAIALFGVPERQTYAPITIPSSSSSSSSSSQNLAPAADGAGIINLYYPRDCTITINASKIYTSTCPSEIYGPDGTIILNATTDIDRVDFLDRKTKKMEQLAVARTQEQRELNLAEEAAEFARIIAKEDSKAEKRLREISLATVRATEDLRRQNGLLFGVER